MIIRRCGISSNSINPPFRCQFTQFYNSSFSVIDHNINILVLSGHKLNHQFPARSTGSSFSSVGRNTEHTIYFIFTMLDISGSSCVNALS